MLEKHSEESILAIQAVLRTLKEDRGVSDKELARKLGLRSGADANRLLNDPDVPAKELLRIVFCLDHGLAKPKKEIAASAKGGEVRSGQESFATTKAIHEVGEAGRVTREQLNHVIDLGTRFLHLATGLDAQHAEEWRAAFREWASSDDSDQ